MVGGDMLGPVAGGLIVALEIFLGRTLEDRYVEVGRVEMEDIHQIFPCHIDGPFLEVITKAPVAEHLEHGVVVGIMPDLFQVVVLATHAQALLRIGTAARLRVANT